MPRDDKGGERKLSDLNDRCFEPQSQHQNVHPFNRTENISFVRCRWVLCRLRSAPFRKADASSHLQTSRALLAFAEAFAALPAGRKSKCARRGPGVNQSFATSSRQSH